mmetsp:Transcript_2027/g.1918  ORF Transcript_2027/g.1918 Transcript_2027/m.1918 type:complete len:395 (+) Transcript_2027:139-1323(+)|eukprot:CAMPEP_0197014500 /NCGR_PEP_ID=MMETSP1380-20130617/70568_1 /TAXON_ID=5936 /ORGANISM="Euplotes crassus, Strain CT5" /LENGTH=394 /DNA_ID=CAMNT_0042439615 /DNA_START=133 /DNA_END=1317 /DNA_ORIENTATION=-
MNDMRLNKEFGRKGSPTKNLFSPKVRGPDQQTAKPLDLDLRKNFDNDREVPVFKNPEEEKSISAIPLEKHSFKEGDITDSRIKYDETGSTIRKSFSPFDMDKSQEIRLEDFEIQKELEIKFGTKLLNLLQNHFENYIVNGEYTCTKKDCPLVKAMKTNFKEHMTTSENDTLSKNSFNHSYRYSVLLSNKDADSNKTNVEKYIENIKIKLKTKELQEYYYDSQNCENVVNSYLRLLEMYHELQIFNRFHQDPSYKEAKIKILETNYLDEFMGELDTGIVSNAIDDELQDFLDIRFLIIPAKINGRLVTYIVEIRDPDIKVDLYYMLEDLKDTEADESNGDDLDTKFREKCSEVIVDLIARAFEAVVYDFKFDDIKADSHEIANLSIMLQEIENRV